MFDNRTVRQLSHEELVRAFHAEREALIAVTREATALFQRVHDIGCELADRDVPEGLTLVQIAAEWKGD